MVASPRAHDLLVCAVSRMRLGDRVPPWVRAELARAPVVVVRHAPYERSMIPVGVRGHRRHERFAFYLEPETVLQRVTPEQLAAEQAWKRSSRGALPPIAHLPLVEEVLSRFGFAWGPAGSVGFELVSGRPTVKPGSDLDLVIRVPERISSQKAAQLHESLATRDVRVDVRLELPSGFASLAEFAVHGPKVLVRTDVGPLLVRDPWAPAGAGS